MTEQEPKPIAGILLTLVPDMPELSDEEWAERDAKIAAERVREQRVQITERNVEYRRELLERGLSATHLDIVLAESQTETPATAAVVGFIGMPAGIWCLSGNVGCGKTMAAHLWLLRGLPPATWLYMVTAASFARESRYGDKFDRLKQPRRLVIDDMGVEYADDKGSFRADLDELIDLRWRSGRATLLTTNADKETLRKRYKSRIIDRLRDRGGWVDVKHPSMRGGQR